MNPLIIIPTFVSARSKGSTSTVTATYDHTTMLTETGPLPRLLESLVDVEGVGSIAILVSSDQNIALQAAEKVQVIAAQYPELRILVIGRDEYTLLCQRMEQLGIGRLQKEIGLSGYGAVRNLGLLIACALGFDSVVFLSDDTVVEDASFLRNAVYGLGKLTRMGIPILAKSGYTYNQEDNPYMDESHKWYNRKWNVEKAFNEALARALNGPRLSRSMSACPACIAIHREAFKRVAFDPWIARGEGLDYVLNLRMYGSDMWFDNKWSLLREPAKFTITEGQRFRQEVYRWIYEFRKLEFSRTQIDLLQVKTDSMYPYPGEFLEPGMARRLRHVARARALFAGDRNAYRAAAKAVSGDASTYAERNCSRYFDFMRIWPEIMNRIANDRIIADAFLAANAERQAADTAFAQNVSKSMFNQQAGAGAVDGSQVAPAERVSPATTGSFAAQMSGGVSLDPGATGEIRLNMAE